MARDPSSAITGGTVLVKSGASSSHVGYDFGCDTLADLTNGTGTGMNGQTLTSPLVISIDGQFTSTSRIDWTPITDSTNTLTVQAISTNKHGGVPGAGSGITFTEDAATEGLRSSTQYLILKDLDIARVPANDRPTSVVLACNRASGSAANWVVQRCIFRGGSSAGAHTGGKVFTNSNWTYMSSVLFESCAMGYFSATNAGGIIGNGSDTTAVKVYHCTAIADDASLATSAYFFRYLTVKNSYAAYGGNGTVYFQWANTDAGSVTFAASDSSGSAAGLDSLAPADHFHADWDAYPWNFSLLGTSTLINAGTAGVATYDLLGNAFDASNPSIGAIQYGAGGASGVAKQASYYSMLRSA